MYRFEIAIILAILGAVGGVCYYNNVAHPCIRTERKMVHHAAWTSFIMVGEVMVPMYHLARSGMEDVCVERKP